MGLWANATRAPAAPRGVAGPAADSDDERMRLFAAITPPPLVLDHVERALDAVGAGSAAGSPLAGRIDSWTADGPGDDPAAEPDDWRLSPLWVARENLHLTLAFYGDIPEGSVPDLHTALTEVARDAAPFELELRGAGTFMGRVLWLGVGGRAERLGALAAACLDASVRPLPEDARPHRPHLTVARVRRESGKGARGGSRRQEARRGRGTRRGHGRDPDRRDVAMPAAPEPLEALAHALAVYTGPVWTVEAFRLLESRPGQGARGGPLYRVVGDYPLAR